jgi:hypothetical protein
MFGSLEHHVFEKMRKTGPSGTLVHRSDVIPDIDGNEREAMILQKDHFQTVVELVFDVWEFRDISIMRHIRSWDMPSIRHVFPRNPIINKYWMNE